MIAVIFEVTPHPGAASRYFEVAAALKADLGPSTVSCLSSVSRAWPGQGTFSR
jgi:hypothetical protein